MAMRVLATIPELLLAADPIAAGEPPDRSIRPAEPRAPRRPRSRTSFPGVSIAALAVVAAAIWSLVAIREATRSGPDAATRRIATEPADAAAAETTLR